MQNKKSLIYYKRFLLEMTAISERCCIFAAQQTTSRSNLTLSLSYSTRKLTYNKFIIVTNLSKNEKIFYELDDHRCGHYCESWFCVMR